MFLVRQEEKVKVKENEKKRERVFISVCVCAVCNVYGQKRVIHTEACIFVNTSVC